MAYRPLEQGDRVKIMMKGHPAFGKFGTVALVNSDYADVVTGDCRWWFIQKDLMVAHDGLHGFYTSSEYYQNVRNYTPPGSVVDDEEEDDPYGGWDIDDFISRIKELEAELEKQNVWK